MSASHLFRPAPATCALLSRLTSSASTNVSRRHICSCPLASRRFTTSIHPQLSSKRKLQTATAYRPSTLDPPPPPPRNAGVPDTSIASSIPQPNDIRPPDIPPDSIASISISEQEAQKSGPAYEVSDTLSTPTSLRPSRNAAQSQQQQQQQNLQEKPQPKRKLRARKAAMNLTPTAIAQLQRLLDQPEPKLIRVGVKNRGCSGLAYHLEYVERPGAFDESVEQEGVKVLIDSKALFSIIGSEMDWVDDKLNQRFIFRNPNINERKLDIPISIDF
ncbi:Iron-sulfur assembly protein 1 [Agyrium rufum]|nr:Iron-sulfur assembly protein 1 [Agyrium rufum]